MRGTARKRMFSTNAQCDGLLLRREASLLTCLSFIHIYSVNPLTIQTLSLPLNLSVSQSADQSLIILSFLHLPTHGLMPGAARKRYLGVGLIFRSEAPLWNYLSFTKSFTPSLSHSLRPSVSKGRINFSILA